VGGDALHLIGVVAHSEGSTVYRDEISGPRANAVQLGQDLAERLLQQGAGRILGHAFASAETRDKEGRVRKRIKPQSNERSLRQTVQRGQPEVSAPPFR